MSWVLLLGNDITEATAKHLHSEVIYLRQSRRLERCEPLKAVI